MDETPPEEIDPSSPAPDPLAGPAPIHPKRVLAAAFGHGFCRTAVHRYNSI